MGYAYNADTLASPVPDYLDAFHLTHDPFEPDPVDDPVFFPGGQREAILDQVAHLSQFSASVVVVVGETGSGRTTLKDMLLLQLQERYLIADIDAAVTTSPQQVFTAIAAALGYRAGADASAGELMAAIRSGLHQLQTGSGRSDNLMLLLDDAHCLSDAVLSALLSLVQAAEAEDELPFQMVLFGDPELMDRLDGFGMVDVLLHDVVLPPLTDDDMADYLHCRLEAAGWDGDLPFSAEEVEQLNSLAAGMPGAVHQPARELLIDKASREDSGPGVVAEPAPGLPVAHIFSVVVLVGVLLMAFFYRDSWLGADDEPVADARVISDSAPVAATSSARPGTAIRLPLGQDNGTQAPIAPRSTPSVPIENTPEVQTVAPAPVPVPAVAATRFSPPAEDGVPPAAGAADAPAESATTTPPAAPAAVPSVPVAPAAPPSGASAAPPASSADERHLLSLPADHYVLQIMASSSKAAVDTYLQRQTNRDALYLYASRRDGKPWYVVVMGSYSSVEMARAGAQSLPPEQKKAGPWPRKISDVQAQIREFRGG